MSEQTITERQQYWLDHIRAADAFEGSLVKYAKANGIEPYAYLRTVFTELPNATTVEEIEALLPVPADDTSVAKVS